MKTGLRVLSTIGIPLVLLWLYSIVWLSVPITVVRPGRISHDQLQHQPVPVPAATSNPTVTTIGNQPGTADPHQQSMAATTKRVETKERSLAQHVWLDTRGGWSPLPEGPAMILPPSHAPLVTLPIAGAHATVGTDGDELPEAITVVSYNVWFGDFHLEERMEALGKLISSKKPHLIALQEITQTILQLILSQEWAKGYFVSDPVGREIRFTGYGVMILSRVPFTQLFIRDFPSRLGRKAVFGMVKVKGSTRPLLFGTFHLESYPEDRPTRVLQMQMYLRIIEASNAGHVVLCGDSNFAADEEREVYAAGGLLDTWHHLYQKTKEDEKKNPGVTFDTELNPMTTAGKTTASIHARTRLDRLFFSPNTITPSSMEIIGTEPIDRELGLWPSDHYGIHVKLGLAPSTESVGTWHRNVVKAAAEGTTAAATSSSAAAPTTSATPAAPPVSSPAVPPK